MGQISGSMASPEHIECSSPVLNVLEVQYLVPGKAKSLFLGPCILSRTLGRIENGVAKRIDISALLVILVLVLLKFVGIVGSDVVLDKSDLGGLSTKHDCGVDRCSCLLIWFEKTTEMIIRSFREWIPEGPRFKCVTKR